MSRLRVILGLAATLLLVAAAPASAAFSIANPSAKPADVAAGGHSDFTVHLEPQGGKIKDIDLHLPPGVVGDPQATDKCPYSRFVADSCPANTQIGRSITTAQLGPLPQTVNGVIYNVAPKGAEAALLGVKITPPVGGTIRLESPVTSRQDGGLDSTIRNLPRQVAGLDITITALDIVLFGRAGDKPFMTNPTSCGPAETVVDAGSYEGEATQVKAAFTPTGCEALKFDPGFSAIVGAPGQTGKRAKPPLTTIVSQGREEANVKSVAVTLPNAIGVNLNDLGRACQVAQLQAGQCPASSQIGDATAVTPLLTEPLAGPVLFAFGPDSTLPDLVLQLKGPLALTLRGSNQLTPAGQVTTFSGIPDVPLEKFELAFTGGSTGLLTLARDICVGKAPRLKAEFTAHSGRTKTLTALPTIDGCSPQTKVTLGSLKKSRPSLRVRVDAGAKRLRRVKVTLPSKLRATGTAKSTVTGSGAKGASLRRAGRSFTIAIPGGGARSVGLSFKSGGLRALKGLSRKAGFRVEITDVTGKRSTRTVRPG